MANTTYGAIKLSTADSVSRMLMKKLGTEDGYKPSEWTDNINLLGALPIRTASGSIAHFEDGADDVPCVSVVANIKPVQEGTGDPSPSNVRPITGNTACEVKNSPFTPVNDVVSFLPIQEGTGTPSLTNVRPIHAPLTITRDDESTLVVYGGSLDVETGELTIEWKPYTGSWTHYASSNSYKAYRSTLTDRAKFTTSAVSNEIGEFGAFSSASMTKNIIQLPTNSVTNFYLALDENEDPDDVQLVYQLYTAEVVQLSATELTRALASLGIETYTKELGQTVYGGTLDLVSGLLTITHTKIDIASLNGWEQHPTYSDIYRCAILNFPNIVRPAVGVAQGTLCEKYKSGLGTSAISDTVDGTIVIGRSGVDYVFIRDSSAIDLSDFITNRLGNSCGFCYPLATPIEVQLTPEEVRTFLGANNFFNDCGGDTEVEYRADIDLLIDELES